MPESPLYNQAPCYWLLRSLQMYIISLLPVPLIVLQVSPPFHSANRRCMYHTMPMEASFWLRLRLWPFQPSLSSIVQNWERSSGCRPGSYTLIYLSGSLPWPLSPGPAFQQWQGLIFTKASVVSSTWAPLWPWTFQKPSWCTAQTQPMTMSSMHELTPP